MFKEGVISLEPRLTIVGAFAEVVFGTGYMATSMVLKTPRMWAKAFNVVLIPLE